MPHWERFKDLCHLCFRLAVHTNRLAELAQLPFLSTGLGIYAALPYFELATCLDAVLFVGGLPEYIRIEVKLWEQTGPPIDIAPRPSV